MKIKKQPEVRFDNYTDEWKMQALKHIVNRVTRKNKELKTQLPLTISAQYGLVDQVTYFNKQVASKDMSNYYLLERGEFAYNKSYSRDYPWGAIKRLDNYDMGALSSLYITFKPIKINSDFLLSYYDTNKWHKEVSTRATEGARNHGLLNISANDFLETELAIPLEEVEQESIGSFFKQLDEAISLHQQELNTLKQTKQGFLQKMFPKEGESVPELRFPDFIEDWEERELSNMTDSIGTGRSSFIKNEKSADDAYPILGSTSIIGYDNEFDHEGDFILTARVGANAGKLYRYHGQVKITDNTVFIKGENLSFLYPLLKHIDLKKLSYGTGQPLVKASELKKLKIKSPSFEEQIQIGNFFKQLDEVITLQQQELDALKQTKKAFLQKMFV